MHCVFNKHDKCTSFNINICKAAMAESMYGSVGKLVINVHMTQNGEPTLLGLKITSG